MPTDKKRILMVGEASWALSGFGRYTREIMHRLYATGKYELAELASFGGIQDKRDRDIPWTYYANKVEPNDHRYKYYDANPINKFGEWRFDKVLLHYKPDIVFSIRDPWMLSFHETSPLRRFFHNCIMPTCDSVPHKDDHIETYIEADSVLTYTDWALKELDKESGGTINLIASAPPGLDLNVYSPTNNRAQHRSNMGLTSDAIIIGSVMRNQVRKLYPDLIKAFERFIEICIENNRQDLAKRTYMHWHTSYPDSGWEIPTILKESAVSHKILFTYVCKNCGSTFISFFSDACTVCPNCHQLEAVLPNVDVGLTKEQMVNIYRCFDVFVQYAVCEGFGMPQTEATACGVPLMAVDYSAMHDVVQKVKGIPLKVQRMFRDAGTGSWRALPDNEYAAKKMFEFCSKPLSLMRQEGYKARKLTEKYYSWDAIAKIWERHFDSIELTGLQGKWDAPPQIHNPPPGIPEGIDNYEFIEWLVIDVLGQPDKVKSLSTMKMLRALNYHAQVIGEKVIRVDREGMYRKCIEKVKARNLAEQIRCGMIEFPMEDYIEYAELRDKIRKEDARK
jgi:glycosyltransferase involved in cell wall biosynthesis